MNELGISDYKYIADGASLVAARAGLPQRLLTPRAGRWQQAGFMSATESRFTFRRDKEGVL